MVFYDYDTNAIIVRPMKTKTSTELTTNIKSIVNKLTKRGFRLLVVPRRLKSRATTITDITVNGKSISVNGKEKTVIDQRKRLSDYLSVLCKSRRKST